MEKMSWRATLISTNPIWNLSRGPGVKLEGNILVNMFSSSISALIRMGFLAFVIAAILLLAGGSMPVQGQALSSFDRDRGRTMLGIIRDDIRKNYFDPNYKGVDLNATFKVADDRIKQATSLGEIFGAIAQFAANFDDSHTLFLPPARPAQPEYGWQMQIIGDKCYVVAVKPGSDAEAKGLKEGDEVHTVDGIGPARENLWKLHYIYNALRPTGGMRLVVNKPDGRRQQLDALAKVREGKRVLDLTSGGDIWDLIRSDENENRLRRHRYVELGQDVFIWKMPSFDLEKAKVDDMSGKFRKSKSLILDLRGNGGGAEETLLRLVGNLFDRDIKIGELRRRKEVKPLLATTRGKDTFHGELVVLVDSESGSAAEILARVVQLEKRGRVIGDRSAGAVMRSKHYSHQHGVDVVIFYGVSVTDADVIMSDGKSLEKTGLTPDEVKLPTPADLAAKRDPVLAYALSLVGGKMTPEEAGKLFPVEWRK
jgi:C-terminal processing protease CtpA/Prc